VQLEELATLYVPGRQAVWVGLNEPSGQAYLHNRERSAAIVVA
jgi:hypothetical protein